MTLFSLSLSLFRTNKSIEWNRNEEEQEEKQIWWKKSCTQTCWFFDSCEYARAFVRIVHFMKAHTNRHYSLLSTFISTIEKRNIACKSAENVGKMAKISLNNFAWIRTSHRVRSGRLALCCNVCVHNACTAIHVFVCFSPLRSVDLTDHIRDKCDSSDSGGGGAVLVCVVCLCNKKKCLQFIIQTCWKESLSKGKP